VVAAVLDGVSAAGAVKAELAVRVAALAERGIAEAGLPGLQVADAQRALGDLASAWRHRFHLPLIAVTASGGARMQENILALMQMAKTVGAVDDLREHGIPYISVLTHPTTGGVIASFAALGDVVIAEPGALLSFAGPRVVEQTTGEKTSADFGRAESNLRLGQLDSVVPRRALRSELAKLLMLFSPAEEEPTGDHEPPPLPPQRAGLGPAERVRNLLRLRGRRG
jgi:acetyl-CoA carboxylase carboxyl transferase subunit beta